MKRWIETILYLNYETFLSNHRFDKKSEMLRNSF
jgi:hypothetical protein